MARERPQISNESDIPTLAPLPPRVHAFDNKRLHEPAPFDEDKHLQIAGPVTDYSFVFSKWTPSDDCPSATDWRELDGGIEFQAIVRGLRGQVRATCRMPKLENKAGKKQFTAEVRRRLAEELKRATT